MEGQDLSTFQHMGKRLIPAAVITSDNKVFIAHIKKKKRGGGTGEEGRRENEFNKPAVPGGNTQKW